MTETTGQDIKFLAQTYGNLKFWDNNPKFWLMDSKNFVFPGQKQASLLNLMYLFLNQKLCCW